jgi:hypothetical protein
MRVFIGGVVQGSNRGNEIDDQSYRRAIARTIKDRHPTAEIVDPMLLHPDSTGYDGGLARQVLFGMAEEAARCDVVIAFLPQASMGTALEMVRAYDAGVPVVSISPMTEGWFVRFLSQRLFPTLQAFEGWVRSGGLAALVDGAWGREEV